MSSGTSRKGGRHYSEAHVERELEQRTDALQVDIQRRLHGEGHEASLRALLPSSRGHAGDDPEMPLTLARALVRAAKEVYPHTVRDWPHGALAALPHAEQILRDTPEMSMEVAARQAAQELFDSSYLVKVKAHLDRPRPTRWYWRRTRKGHRQEWDGTSEDYEPPISHREAQHLAGMKPPLAAAVGGEVLWEPQWSLSQANGKPLIRQRFSRMLDHMRPPLLAVRLAASIIKTRALAARPVVISYEQGHSVGPQALSIWLPSAEVHTRSTVLDPETPLEPVGQADVVVLGVPSLLAFWFSWLMAEAGRGRLVGQEVARTFLRSASKEDPLTHIKALVDDATGLVQAGGLFILLGATEHGEHHHAAALVAAQGCWRPISIQSGRDQLNTVERPILAAYRPGKEPWRPYGTLGPEDRLLSAWRRLP